VFVHRLRVRFHECDPQGVVFNAHYFSYFDVALTEMWRAAFGSYANVVQDGTDVVVVEAGATFRAPARFDDEVDVELAIERLGTTSMTMAAAVRRDGQLLVEGRMVHVFVDPATMAKKEIPANIRAGLEPYATVRRVHEIEARERELQAAVAARDVVALDRLLGPEFTLTTGRPGNEVRGRAEYLEITASRYVIDEYRFDELEVIELGPGAAMVRSRYVQRGSMDGADRSQPFLMTDVWAHRPTGWQLVARHVSPLASSGP
jgi:acyl-CoA thioester hydrolase